MTAQPTGHTVIVHRWRDQYAHYTSYLDHLAAPVTFDGTRPGPWRASRYLNDCLGFTHGHPLGSVEVDDPGLLAGIGDEVALQVGRPPEIPPPSGGPSGGRPVGGWLLVPAPEDRPCRVVRSCSLTGTPDGPYAERVLPAGEVIPASYEHVGGRFRFRGTGSGRVERAIRAAVSGFDLACELLRPATVGGVVA